MLTVILKKLMIWNTCLQFDLNHMAGADLSYEFSDGLNIVGTRFAGEIACAIRLVLNHKPSRQGISLLRKGTRVEALLCIDGKQYRVIVAHEKSAGEKYHEREACGFEAVGSYELSCYGENGENLTEEYLRLTSHPREHDLSDVFDGREDEVLLRFLKYKYEDLYYLPRELSVETDGLSDIKAFRAYLRSFIEGFKPELIRDGKQYEITLEKNGRYVPKCKINGEVPVLFSTSDLTLFRYLCFLRTAEFWHGFECMRNLHGTGKPLVIKDFLEKLDGSVNIQPLLERTKKLNRQVIILTAPNIDAAFATAPV